MVIAKAVAVAGNVYANNLEGTLRTVCVGDELVEGETVITPSGGRVELELLDGSRLEVSELTGTRLDRDLLGTVPLRGASNSADKAAGNLEQCPRFSRQIADGPVRTRLGENLFYNELPLYWSVDCDARTARAIVPAGCADVVVDQVAFTLRLEDSEYCTLELEDGLFLVETHNIPFTTGEPQPGLPVAFYGIREGVIAYGREQASAAGNGDTFSADLGDLGNCNNWYREGRDIVFEFLGRPSCPGAESGQLRLPDTRAINNFSFSNGATAAIALVITAYRGGAREPVFKAGSEAEPLLLAPGGIQMVSSEFNYDRLVLTEGGGDGAANTALNLEGYSEFVPTAGAVALPVKLDSAKAGLETELAFSVNRGVQGTGLSRRLSLREARRAVAPLYDSVWDRLTAAD